MGKNKGKKKEKLFSITKKDLIFQTFKAGGKGGQHQNKTDSGVRVIHEPSGARGESRSERSQHYNKRIALRRLMETPEFKLWVNRVACEKIGTLRSIEKVVDESMSPENIKIDVFENGHWVTVD